MWFIRWIITVGNNFLKSLSLLGRFLEKGVMGPYVVFFSKIKNLGQSTHPNLNIMAVLKRKSDKDFKKWFPTGVIHPINHNYQNFKQFWAQIVGHAPTPKTAQPLLTNISFCSSNTQFYESWIFCLFTYWVFFPDKSFKWVSKYTQKCQYYSL